MDSEHQRLIGLYHKALGYDPTSWPKEAKGIKSILSRGFTPEQAIECYEYYKVQPFWRDKHLSMTYIAQQISAWQAATKPSKSMEDDDLMAWFKENNS